jgi:hypothetical protein
MHAFAVFAINEHIEFLLDEAAQRRARARTTPSVRKRVMAAVTSLRTSAALNGLVRTAMPLPR